MGRQRTHNPQEAVNRVLRSGHTIKAVATDLGMRESTVYNYLHGAGFFLQYVSQDEYAMVMKAREMAQS